MKPGNETNLALFVDFDNVALGARDARQRFDIQIVLQRLLEKGKIIVKRAYADWSHHKEYLADLHQAGLELIEIPSPQMSGKNSADIRLVVDAMDLCYGKEHLDTFVIVSGDSDFTPLVSKLRENGKSVIGVGVRNSSSHLLIVNCDEFIFYDDLYLERVGQQVEGLTSLPGEKRKLFDFLLTTIQGLMRESRGVLYSSLIKDTMKRKQPEFNEHKYGYSNFGDLLEDAMEQGLLRAERDSRAGGTWVVSSLGKGLVRPAPVGGGRGAAPRKRNGRSRRRRDSSREGMGEELAARQPAIGAVPSDGSGAATSEVAVDAALARTADVGGSAATTTGREPDAKRPDVAAAGARQTGAHGPADAQEAAERPVGAEAPATAAGSSKATPARRGRRGRKPAKSPAAPPAAKAPATPAKDATVLDEAKGAKTSAGSAGRPRQKTTRKKAPTRRKTATGEQGGAD